MTLNYSPKVMQHFRKPQNMGEIKNADGVGRVGNPVCGDVMQIFIKVKKDGGKESIEDIKFQTLGCVAAISISSIITELAKGKSLPEAMKITDKDVVRSLGQLPPQKYHCSLLAEQALKAAIRDYYKKKPTGEIKRFTVEEIKRISDLAKTKKYSVPYLAKKFHCDRKTIFRILRKADIHVPNLGKFERKIDCNDDFFSRLDKKSAYWLGFIAADGTLSYRDNMVSIGLNKKDRNHLLKFKKAIGTNAKVSSLKSNNSVKISIYSRSLLLSLVKRGITPNKSLNIEKVDVPPRLLTHFIRGVFDGDGTLSGRDRSHIQFSIAGNSVFLEQIQYFLVKNVGVNKTKLYKLATGKARKIQYTGSQVFKILDRLYDGSASQTRLERKYKKYLDYRNRFVKSETNKSQEKKEKRFR